MPILTDQQRLGTTIGDGKYTLECILGRGGMGTVFEAIHTWTGRRVAVKLMVNEMALDVDASRRFLQEARSATAIAHPNVVEVLDMGRHDESSVYMVFELLRGESLADRLESNGPLDTMQAAVILLPVADALAAAHRLGIVHRDVKPENIFLEDDGMGYVRPKLLDFGIASFSDRGRGVTRPGVIMGTPGYLSPEHAQGFHAGPASDVWSLGVVLFECITGYCPFESETLAGAILAIASRPVPSLRDSLDVPEPIAELLERTLVRDPAVRFPDGAAFRDALAAASQVEFVPSRSRSVPPKIVSDSGELSLSSAHRVEVRQSSPTSEWLSPVPPPTPLPESRAIPLSLELPRGGVAPLEHEAVTLRIDSARGAARPLVDSTATRGADDELEAPEASAVLVSRLPQRGRWRRPGVFGLLVLLVFLVHLVVVTYRPTLPEGSRMAGNVVTAAAAGSASVAPGATLPESASTTSPPDLGFLVDASPAAVGVACAPDGSPVPPVSASTGHATATATRGHARNPLGSGRSDAFDPGAAPVVADPQPFDAGPQPVDAGAGRVDAGAQPFDAGMVPVDGTAPIDWAPPDERT